MVEIVADESPAPRVPCSATISFLSLTDNDSRSTPPRIALISPRAGISASDIYRQAVLVEQVGREEHPLSTRVLLLSIRGAYVADYSDKATDCREAKTIPRFH